MTRRVAGAALLALASAAVLGATALPVDTFDGAALLAGPSRAHPLGTDDRGRDLLALLAHGTVGGLRLGLGAALGALVLGVPAGMVAAAARTGRGPGRVLEATLVATTDALGAVPPLLALLVASTLLGNTDIVLGAVLAASGAVSAFRMARGAADAALRTRWYEAAEWSGLRRWTLLRFHVGPQVLRPVLALVPFLVTGALLAQAGLAFVGVGGAGEASLGDLLAQSVAYADRDAWHLAVFPGAVLATLLLMLHLLSDRPA